MIKALEDTLRKFPREENKKDKEGNKERTDEKFIPTAESQGFQNHDEGYKIARENTPESQNMSFENERATKWPAR